MNRATPLLALVLVAGFGCRNPEPTRPSRDVPPPDVLATTIDYADTDAFDALFESTLVNQDPVIVIRTAQPRPDWQGRLNAWIAAWNMGGKVEGRTARGQIPPVGVNGDSIREFRLLVTALMDRVEELAKTGAGWWSEARLRNRRVELLRPYNLRFHVGDDGNIQLIFFNGRANGQYAEFVRRLTGDAAAGPWARTFECSDCRPARDRLAGGTVKANSAN
jgi:hypothetical protein